MTPQPLNRPVDVLAVLDEAGSWLPYDGEDNRILDRFVEARAAVAELIKAAREMNRLAKGPAGGVSVSDKRAIVARMDAALAAVEGQP